MASKPEKLDNYDDYRDAIEQLHDDSDRAAAVVAGAVVEIALTNAIQRRLHDHPVALRPLFTPSGPLGPFKNKIDLGFLMGIYPRNVYDELITIKDLRNAFAHRVAIKSFAIAEIRAECANLKIVEKHTEEMRPRKGLQASLPIFLKNKEDKLKEPRMRYVLSAEVLAALLWANSSIISCPSPPDPEPSMW
jgi:hypothetical protein